MVGCYSFTVVFAVSLALLLYDERRPVVMQKHMTG